MYKKIFVLLLLICSIKAYSQNFGISLYPASIDSVVVKMIDPLLQTFGGVSFDRAHFDEIYDYYTRNDSIDGSFETFKCKLCNWNEIVMFTSILNNLIPLAEEEIKVYPCEVKTKEGYNYHQPLIMNNVITNDPIETRIKICIYKKSGLVLTAFMSLSAIDIFNYRYKSGALGSFVLFYVLGTDFIKD